MLKWLLFLFLMEVVSPAISLPSVKENYNIDTCVKNGGVGTACTTHEGAPGACIYSQYCISNINVDVTENSIGKRDHYVANIPVYVTVALYEGTHPPIEVGSDQIRILCIKDVNVEINRVKRNSASKDCGLRNPNFSENQTPKFQATYGELPWMVNILEVTGSNDNGATFTFKYVGSGAFIRKRVVLTAAHVVNEVPVSMLYIAVGDHDQLNKDDKNKRIIKVLSVKIHNEFEPGYFSNDVALLLIQDKPNIKTICLPPPSMEPPTDTVCFQSGWGKDKGKNHQYILSKVDLKIVDRNTCQYRLSRSDLGPSFLLNSTFICAEGDPGVDTCRGSGGSPLVCPIKGQEGRFEVWGIAAATLKCGQDGSPDLFANISYLHSWITDRLFGWGLIERN